MHHVGLSTGEAITLAARILGELKLDLEPAALENPLGDTGMKRERLGLGKGIDAQDRGLIRAAGRHDAEGERAGQHEASRQGATADGAGQLGEIGHGFLLARSANDGALL